MNKPDGVKVVNLPFPDRIHLRFDKDYFPEIYWQSGDDTKEYIRLYHVKAVTIAMLCELNIAANNAGLTPNDLETVTINADDLRKLSDLLYGQQGAEGVGDE